MQKKDLDFSTTIKQSPCPKTIMKMPKTQADKPEWKVRHEQCKSGVSRHKQGKSEDRQLE